MGAPPRRTFCRQRDRDASASCAEVEEAQGRVGHPAPVEELQRSFDEMLRFRTRDERMFIHSEIAPVELARAENVGQRLSAGTARQQIFEPGFNLFGHGLFRVSDESHTVDAEHMAQQELGRQGGGICAGKAARRLYLPVLSGHST